MRALPQDSHELIRENKVRLREKALFRREKLPEEYRNISSGQIFGRVCELTEYQESDSILCYVSFGSEVETKNFLDRALRDGKKVYAPRVISRGVMHFYLYEPERLVRGRWGIEEPPEDPSKIFPEGKIEDETACLVIVPGSVFDLRCGRIGYNGGFYDRFLSQNPALILRTCAVAFDTQIVTEVPQEEHDVRPARVITEKRMIKTRDGNLTSEFRMKDRS